jgi:hypothetical protein
MVMRRDGQQVGVEPDDTHDDLKCYTLGMHRACNNSSIGDFCRNFINFRMVIGAISPFENREPLEDCAMVVAIRESSTSPIRLIATRSAYDPEEEDLEGLGLPREVTFDEVLKKGELIGRFERATWEDIEWFFNYCADNNNRWPAPHTSFPSAEGPGPGPNGCQGAVRAGKAVAVTVVD